ncbi:hypothetical protein DESC_530017 [Desulfosarcina cetonica]|nr:hypothetical protein DESC_530017 [Desulfosarcina cetonica]
MSFIQVDTKIQDSHRNNIIHLLGRLAVDKPLGNCYRVNGKHGINGSLGIEGNKGYDGIKRREASDCF